MRVDILGLRAKDPTQKANGRRPNFLSFSCWNQCKIDGETLLLQACTNIPYRRLFKFRLLFKVRKKPTGAPKVPRGVVRQF